MTILPNKYDVNTPENRGWLALYLTIITDLSGDEALRRMGVKPLIESIYDEEVHKKKGCRSNQSPVEETRCDLISAVCETV